MAETYKTEIILELFRKRWDPATKTLSDPIVTTVDIRREYEAYQKRRGLEVKNTNPPAFLKDFLRKLHTANKNWPQEVFEAGYSARPLPGKGKNFEFISIQPGQTEPFPSTAPLPPLNTPAHQLSSIGLPLASRRLGRPDEQWLIQASVRLHVVESYFALFSTRKAIIRQVDHLQNGLKLRRTEIDALFLGIEETEPGKFEEFVITCEAKRIGQTIISEQMLEQVKAVFNLANVNQKFAVPIALKSVAQSQIQIIEHDCVVDTTGTRASVPADRPSTP